MTARMPRKRYYDRVRRMVGLPKGDASPPLAIPVSDTKAISTISELDYTKPKKNICCACPETKRLRDECIVEHGEDACTKWIKAHLICLRAEGFKV